MTKQYEVPEECTTKETDLVGRGFSLAPILPDEVDTQVNGTGPIIYSDNESWVRSSGTSSTGDRFNPELVLNFIEQGSRFTVDDSSICIRVRRSRNNNKCPLLTRKDEEETGESFFYVFLLIEERREDSIVRGSMEDPLLG